MRVLTHVVVYARHAAGRRRTESFRFPVQAAGTAFIAVTLRHERNSLGGRAAIRREP